jgi:hypothetical protein
MRAKEVREMIERGLGYAESFREMDAEETAARVDAYVDILEDLLQAIEKRELAG